VSISFQGLKKIARVIKIRQSKRQFLLEFVWDLGGYPTSGPS